MKRNTGKQGLPSGHRIEGGLLYKQYGNRGFTCREWGIGNIRLYLRENVKMYELFHDNLRVHFQGRSFVKNCLESNKNIIPYPNHFVPFSPKTLGWQCVLFLLYSTRISITLPTMMCTVWFLPHPHFLSSFPMKGFITRKPIFFLFSWTTYLLWIILVRDKTSVQVINSSFHNFIEKNIIIKTDGLPWNPLDLSENNGINIKIDELRKSWMRFIQKRTAQYKLSNIFIIVSPVFVTTTRSKYQHLPRYY